MLQRGWREFVFFQHEEVGNRKFYEVSSCSFLSNPCALKSVDFFYGFRPENLATTSQKPPYFTTSPSGKPPDLYKFLGRKLAQHTTPIAKTHRTATLFASEPTKNLKMFIGIHHRNITIPSRSPQHHHPSLRHQGITDTEQRHHQHKTKASPTYHQNITTQSLHITETRRRHHRHII